MKYKEVLLLKIMSIDGIKNLESKWKNRNESARFDEGLNRIRNSWISL